MTRKVNRKELCEAIRQGQARMKERLDCSVDTEPKVRPEPVRFQLRKPTIVKKDKRPRRPLIPAALRKYRPNPKYLAAAAAMAFFIIGVAWLGKAMSRQESTVAGLNPPAERTEAPSMRPVTPTAPIRPSAPPRQTPAPVTETKTPVRQSAPKPAAENKTPAVSLPKGGDHVIVIATYTQREQLIPVQEYFRSSGIETDIMRRGSYYLLVTKDMYESPRRPGTNGYEAIQRIRTLGGQYKAPGGFESFGKTPFQDAYGMKVSN